MSDRSPQDEPRGTEGDATNRLARIFAYLADRDFRGYSPLYEHLARRIADDPDISARVAAANPHNTAPILFFACTHDLVLRHPDSELATIYAAVSAGADPAATDAWPAFRALVADSADELDQLLRTRHVQTNEVGRSAALLPAVTMAARRARRPLALIEVGASAGLNLAFDRYRITYNEGDREQTVGPPGGEVRLRCELFGARRPPLPGTEPTGHAQLAIASRLGLDREPVDVTDPDAVRWLQACLWPDLTDRRARLDAAVAAAAADPPELWTGDAVDLVEPAVAATPPDAVACIVSTWVLAYLSHEHRRELHERIDALGQHRPLAWITAEYEANVGWLAPVGRAPSIDPGQLPTRLAIEWWDGAGGRVQTSLAWMHAHGLWLEWLERDDGEADEVL